MTLQFCEIVGGFGGDWFVLLMDVIGYFTDSLEIFHVIFHSISDIQWSMEFPIGNSTILRVYRLSGLGITDQGFVAFWEK